MTLTGNLHLVTCLEESNEASPTDEPYVLITSVQLNGLPDVRTFLYGPWEMDDGDTVTIVTEAPFWGLDSQPRQIGNPNDVLFIATVMENDAGSPDGYRMYVQSVVSAAAAGTIGIADRGIRVNRILTDLRSALNGHPANDVPLVPSDDHVGTVDITLAPADLPPTVGYLDKRLHIDGGKNGTYDLTVRFGRHAQIGFRQDTRTAAVSRHHNHLEIWAVDNDGTLRGNWLDGRWQGWYALGGAQFDPRVRPAAVSRHKNHQEVWAVGQDGIVRGNWFDDGRWHDWYALEGAKFRAQAHVAAVSRHSNHMELFAIDEGGRLRMAWFDNGRWDGWGTLDPGTGELFPPGGPVTAVARDADHQEVWVLSDGGEVKGTYLQDGEWQRWIIYGGAQFPPDAGLSSVTRHADHMELFAVDTQGLLRHNSFDGDNWSGWQTFAKGGFTPGSDVASVSRHPDRMEAWVLGLDGVVRGIWYDDGAWNDWYALAGGGFSAGVDLTAVARGRHPGVPVLIPENDPQRMELWCVGTDGTLRGNWFDGQWRGWYSLPWSYEGGA